MECGQSTAATPAPTQVVQYAPAHLTQRILANKASPEGQRKHVTVMFADIKGSMERLQITRFRPWRMTLLAHCELLAI